jgi:hypothetical protein
LSAPSQGRVRLPVDEKSENFNHANKFKSLLTGGVYQPFPASPAG